MKTAAPNSSTVTHALRCVHCAALQPADALPSPSFRCARCGELLEVIYPELAGAGREFGLRLKEIWRERKTSSLPDDASGVWRFRELLPHIEPRHVVTMSEGNTPLLPLEKLERTLGTGPLFAKHQGMNPTGSFKDTGISVAISMARAQGFSSVCCASTGNTSASLAPYPPRARMTTIVLLPAAHL